MWRHVLPWFAALAVCGHTAGGHASDFWDEVRTPGLAAHTALMLEVTAAVRREEGHHALQLLTGDSPHFAQDPQVLVVRGLAVALTGDTSRAIGLLREALSLDARALDDAGWGSRAALVAAKASEFEFASSVLGRVVGGLPAVPARRELYAMLGDMLLAQGPARLEEALVAYQEAMRGTTRDDVRSVLGLALALSRNSETAVSHEVASRLVAASRTEVVVNALPVPDSEKAARLAIAREALGNMDAAIEEWGRAAADPLWQAHARIEIARLQQGQAGRKRARTR